MEKKLKIRNAHSVLGRTASLMVLAGSLVASQRFKGGKSWAVALGGAAAAAAIDGLSNKEVVRCLGIPAKLNACSEGSRTAFRDDPEHHRSVATLASRLCGKAFGFVKRNLSGAQRRKDAANGERGAGKGAAALVPAQHWRDPERGQRSRHWQ